MTSTHMFVVQHGTSGSSTTVTSANNLNLMSVDDFDQDGELYKENPITVPESGTNHSYERYWFNRFSGTYNKIENMKTWRESGSSLSDENLVYKGGTGGENYDTPTDSDSSHADNTTDEWTGEASAISVEPTLLSGSGGQDTEYIVLQLDAPDDVTTPGDIGTQTIYFQWDES